jgi:hypothetical protein
MVVVTAWGRRIADCVAGSGRTSPNGRLPEKGSGPAYQLTSEKRRLVTDSRARTQLTVISFLAGSYVTVRRPYCVPLLHFPPDVS